MNEIQYHFRTDTAATGYFFRDASGYLGSREKKFYLNTHPYFTPPSDDLQSKNPQNRTTIAAAFQLFNFQRESLALPNFVCFKTQPDLHSLLSLLTTRSL